MRQHGETKPVIRMTLSATVLADCVNSAAFQPRRWSLPRVSEICPCLPGLHFPRHAMQRDAKGAMGDKGGEASSVALSTIPSEDVSAARGPPAQTVETRASWFAAGVVLFVLRSHTVRPCCGRGSQAHCRGAGERALNSGARQFAGLARLRNGGVWLLAGSPSASAFGDGRLWRGHDRNWTLSSPPRVERGSCSSDTVCCWGCSGAAPSMCLSLFTSRAGSIAGAARQLRSCRAGNTLPVRFGRR